MAKSITFSVLFIIGCVALTACFHFWTFLNTPPIFLLTLVFIFLTVIYLIAIRKFSTENKINIIAPLLFAAILGRIILIFTPIYLTGDIARYLWEGHVVREGFNPFLYAPNAPELEAIRNSYWSKIEYKDLTAIYPPFSQLLFALTAKSSYIWRAFLWLCECGSIFLIISILRRRNLPVGKVLIYALLPLSLIEICLSGHLEGVVVFFLLLFFFSLTVANKTISQIGQVVSATLGILSKFVIALPLLTNLILSFKKTGLKQTLVISVGTVLLVVIGFVPFISGDASLFGSLTTYLTHWRFNDSIFHLLGSALGIDWNIAQSFLPLKFCMVIVWIGIYVFLLKRFKEVTIVSAYAFACYLLLGPVFHPWYALWFAPLLCFINSRALLYLCIIIPISYGSLFVGAKDPHWIIKLVEFLPAYCLLFWEIKLGRTPISK